MFFNIIRCSILLIILLTWFAVTTNQTKLESLALPSPGAIVDVLKNNYTNLLYYTISTFFRVFVGASVGACLGIIAALAMLYSRLIAAALGFIIELLRPVPPIALTPFFIFWFGIGNTGQVILIAMVSFLIFTVALFEAGLAIDLKYLRAARLFGADRLQILWYVVLPGCLPQLGIAARLSAAGAISVSVAAEYLGAQGGLGYLIRNARVTLQTDVILVAIIILGLISFIIDVAIRYCFRRLTDWLPTETRGT